MSLTQAIVDPSCAGMYFNLEAHFRDKRKTVPTADLVFVTLGRGRANDMVVEENKQADLEASKTHVVFTCDSVGNVSAMDVASTNGTFVGGDRLRPYAPRPLRDGDVLRLGADTFTVDGFAVSNPLVFLYSARDPPPARARARRRADPVSREAALEALTCAICSDVIVNARVSLCGHAACHSCLVSWFVTAKRDCPLCRAEQPRGVHPVPCLAIDNLVRMYMDANASVAERAAYERRAAHAKIADAVRARCEAVGQAKE